MTICPTYVADLAERARSLLDPDRLISAEEVLSDRTIIPDCGGVYGWWFDIPPSGLPPEGTLEKDGYRLFYVGIAPRKPSAAGSYSSSTLRRRIGRNHLGNRIASSTLRRSLAWLLKDEVGLSISLNAAGKQVIPAVDEALLTLWMRNHAALSFTVDPEPWILEDALIERGPMLPMNIRGSSHPFSDHLRRTRSYVV